jgi:hypothetical protein
VAEQIVVAALPSLEVMSDASFGRSVELLHELIVNNGERITHCMSRLPVLPEHEDLREINRIVENQRGSLSFSDRIDVIVDSLDHESIAVKGVSLRELIRLLQENRNEVTVMIEQDSARARQSMGRLIRSVLKCASDLVIVAMSLLYVIYRYLFCRCCAEEGTTKLSSRVQMRAADALANIGALDPHRISFDRREVDKVELHVRVLGRRLLCEHVVRVIRGTNDFKSLLNALYAAQEILRYFGCRSSDDAKVQAYGTMLPPKCNAMCRGMILRFSDGWYRDAERRIGLLAMAAARREKGHRTMPELKIRHHRIVAALLDTDH